MPKGKSPTDRVIAKIKVLTPTKVKPEKWSEKAKKMIKNRVGMMKRVHGALSPEEAYNDALKTGSLLSKKLEPLPTKKRPLLKSKLAELGHETPISKRNKKRSSQLIDRRKK